MDMQILRAIVQSNGEVMKGLENSEVFERSLVEKNFPPMDRTILAALTTSFTDLISYKVSPMIYQRYAVRIQVIEIFREWIRPSRELDSSGTFAQINRVLEFIARLMRIYMNKGLLRSDDGDIKLLVNLAQALMCIAPKQRSFLHDLRKLLRKIAELRQTEESRCLLFLALEEKDSLELCPETLESLWISQRVKIVEEPLIENFLANLKDSSSESNFTNSEEMEQLLNISAESATIFHIACSVLKEIFVYLEYSQRVIDYTRHYLNCVDKICAKKHKNILDLYPLEYQATIILLKISPEEHTLKSRQYTLNTLETLHFTRPKDALILLIHFSSWLQLLSDRIKENSRIAESLSSIEIITDEDYSLSYENEK